MNAALNITSLVDESALYQLIAKARSIASQLQDSVDDEELEDLSSDLVAVNDCIIRAPTASMDEVRQKAGYLLETDDSFDAAVIQPLLLSFAGRTV